MRLPGLIDVNRVRDPLAVTSVASDTRLSRAEPGRGPLVNRLIARIASALLTASHHKLPSGGGPGDPDRLALREALMARLSDPELDGRLAGPVADSAAYVAGGEGDSMALAQALLAPAVHDDLTPDERTVKAAMTIGAALNGGLVWQLADWLFGRSAHARDILYSACKHDLNAVHALGIASQNLAASLEILRASDAATPAKIALARALTAPKQVLRQGRGPAETLAGPVRDGTLVVLQTADVTRRTLDPKLAFLSDAWSGCPARDFVPKLLQRIWQQAGGAP